MTQIEKLLQLTQALSKRVWGVSYCLPQEVELAMASDSSSTRSPVSHNKCAQSSVFPELCTDPSGRDRGCLLILPRLFPSHTLPQALPSTLTVSGHLSHTRYFVCKGGGKSKHFSALFSTATRGSPRAAQQFFRCAQVLSLSWICRLLH